MSITSGTLAVGTAAVSIPVTCVMPWRLEVKNNDNTDAVYIGDENVTTTNGMPLAKEERVELTLAPLDRLYVVATKAGHSISFIRFSQSC